MAVIRDMLSRMEAEHKTKLEQLHSMQEQQRCPLHLNHPILSVTKYRMLLVNGNVVQICFAFKNRQMNMIDNAMTNRA